MATDICWINADTGIPMNELRFTSARAGGPGGQHVNKVNSKVSLFFDLNATPSLSSEQKALIRKRLAARINRQGELRIDCGATRSQAMNRQLAISRFAALMAEALYRPKTRRPTRPGAAAREKRLQAKRHRARIKKQRRRAITDE